jgi:hypothetical protein
MRRGVENVRLVVPECLVTVPNGVPLPGPGPRLGQLRDRVQRDFGLDLMLERTEAV